MLFSSITFLFLFLPIVLAVYYLVPERAKNIVLLLASLLFYAWGEPVYVVLMILSIALNYFCGQDIKNHEDEEREALGVSYPLSQYSDMLENDLNNSSMAKKIFEFI